MQTFKDYLVDIWKYSSLSNDFDIWLQQLPQDNLFNYANDYAKECIREYAMKLHIQNEKNKQNTQEDTGAYKYDWAYEEFEEVINNNLK